MTVILINALSADSIRRRSLARPGHLVVDIRANRMARDGVVAEIRGNPARMALAVASRPRAVIPAEEMVELLWGHRPDGGPDRADQSLTADWAMARTALLALGFVAERRFAFGFSAWPIEWARPDELETVDIPRFLSAREEMRA